MHSEDKKTHQPSVQGEFRVWGQEQCSLYIQHRTQRVPGTFNWDSLTDSQDQTLSGSKGGLKRWVGLKCKQEAKQIWLTGGLLQSWLLHSHGDAAMTHIMSLEKVWIKKKNNTTAYKKLLALNGKESKHKWSRHVFLGRHGPPSPVWLVVPLRKHGGGGAYLRARCLDRRFMKQQVTAAMMTMPTNKAEDTPMTRGMRSRSATGDGVHR